MQASKAGEHAYAGAEYDLATAHNVLGTTLMQGGHQDRAIGSLTEASERYTTLAKDGNTDATRAVGESTVRLGYCLASTGQFRAAIEAYRKSIDSFRMYGYPLESATIQGQLGDLLLSDQRYDEAIAAYTAALLVFDTLNEPRGVAWVSEKIARVREQSGRPL